MNKYKKDDIVHHTEHPLFEIRIISHSHANFYEAYGWDCKGKFQTGLWWLCNTRTFKEN